MQLTTEADPPTNDKEKTEDHRSILLTAPAHSTQPKRPGRFDTKDGVTGLKESSGLDTEPASHSVHEADRFSGDSSLRVRYCSDTTLTQLSMCQVARIKGRDHNTKPMLDKESLIDIIRKKTPRLLHAIDEESLYSAYEITMHALSIPTEKRDAQTIFFQAATGCACEARVAAEMGLSKATRTGSPQFYDLIAPDGTKYEVKLRSRGMFDLRWYDVGRMYGNPTDEDLRKKTQNEEWDTMVLCSLNEDESDFEMRATLDRRTYNSKSVLGKYETSKNKILVPAAATKTIHRPAPKTYEMTEDDLRCVNRTLELAHMLTQGRVTAPPREAAVLRACASGSNHTSHIPSE